MASTKLGRVQLMIMQVLWAKRRASARQITETLNQTEPLAHSTVQTLLRGLEDKGSVAHEMDGRTFVFYPLVKEDKFKRSATRELLERVFGGDVGSLVAHLLQYATISAKEISEIRKLIDERDTNEK